MAKITTLFPIHIYRADMAISTGLNAELEADIGKRYCEAYIPRAPG